MTDPINLADAEIQKRVEAAIAGEIAKGTNPADIDETRLAAIVGGVVDDMSPSARKRSAMVTLTTIAEQVCGSFVAEKMWDAGFGWLATDAQIMECGRRARIGDGDILSSLTAFRAALMGFTIDEAKEFRALERFLPLFVLQPDKATLGEIANRKAAKGDKLALQLITWKETP